MDRPDDPVTRQEFDNFLNNHFHTLEDRVENVRLKVATIDGKTTAMLSLSTAVVAIVATILVVVLL